MSVFIVQESVHADHVSRHESREDAVEAIREMLREGLASPGQFNIRQVDDDGRTVDVFAVPDSAESQRVA